MLLASTRTRTTTLRAAARQHKCFVLGFRQRRGRDTHARPVLAGSRTKRSICDLLATTGGTVPYCTSSRSSRVRVLVLYSYGTVLYSRLAILVLVLLYSYLYCTVLSALCYFDINAVLRATSRRVSRDKFESGRQKRDEHEQEVREGEHFCRKSAVSRFDVLIPLILRYKSRRRSGRSYDDISPGDGGTPDHS